MSAYKKTHPNSFAIAILTASLSVIIFILIFFRIDANTNHENITYINSCGYQVEESPFDISHITIPEELDTVYTIYNSIIAKGGFDLNNHRGKRAVRYSYNVLNYEDPAPLVRINIIRVADKIVAADISSLEENGFVLPLFPKET